MGGQIAKRKINVVELQSRLDAFEAPFLEKKLIDTGVFTNVEEYQTAFREFKRYAFLTTVSSEKIPMLSATVDAVWHQFILFTREYFNFCDSFLGFYLHHAPKQEGMDMGTRVHFESIYSHYFGSPSPLWKKMKADCGGDCADGCNGSDCTGN